MGQILVLTEQYINEVYDFLFGYQKVERNGFGRFFNHFTNFKQNNKASIEPQFSQNPRLKSFFLQLTKNSHDVIIIPTLQQEYS